MDIMLTKPTKPTQHVFIEDCLKGPEKKPELVFLFRPTVWNTYEMNHDYLPKEEVAAKDFSARYSALLAEGYYLPDQRS